MWVECCSIAALLSWPLQLKGRGRQCGRNRGRGRHSGTSVVASCVGCKKPEGAEALAMAMGELALEAKALAPEVQGHHRTKAQGRWDRTPQCNLRNLRQTDGTSRCCPLHSHRSHRRTCSSPQKQVAMGELALEAMALAQEVQGHQCTKAQGHWDRTLHCILRNSRRTGGTSQCCHLHNRRNHRRTCSNPQKMGALGLEAMAALGHHSM